MQTNTTETSNISLTKDVEIISDAAAGSSTALRTVTAASGENVTITSSADLVSLENIAFASLKGFTVQSGCVFMTDGSFSSCSATDGGAVNVANGAQFYGDTVTFSACSATNYGGAIYSEGDVSLETCSITGCSAGHGGAIFAKNCELGLNNCTISGNSSTSEAGAIQLSGSDTTPASLIMYECIIGTETPSALASATKDECLAAGGNYSSGGGGGILLGNYSTLTSTNSKINGNYSGGAGGGINAGGTSSNTNVTVKITGGEICYNRANNNAGGLQVYSLKTCGSFVKNTKIQNNHANGSGGGVSITTGHYLKMENCTNVSGNSAGSVKGCYAAGSLTLIGNTYIEDGIYLNKNDTPLLLESSFALSGSDKIPLSYRTTESNQFTTGATLLKGEDSHSVTASQCEAFELADDTFKIKHNTLASPNTGILAESSGVGAFKVGPSETYTTIKAALDAINLLDPASVDDKYEIQICGDLTLTEDLQINTPNIKITSDLATPPTINSTNYMITVNPGSGNDVEIEKINFSGLKGGIDIESGQLTINNSTVMNGSTYNSDYAAGITIKQGATLKSEEGLVIDSCDNNIDSGHSGIFNNGGSVDLTGATIKNCDNTNSGAGGGIYTKPYIWASTSNAVNLENCIITNNTAGTGGGIYCYGTEITIKGGEISSNEAKYGEGGGIYLSNGGGDFVGKFIMQDSALIIKDNKVTSGTYGGGIYIISGEAKLILNSTSKDTNNTSSSGKLCYIASGVTILSGSNINGNSWPSDETISSSHIAN